MLRNVIWEENCEEFGIDVANYISKILEVSDWEELSSFRNNPLGALTKRIKEYRFLIRDLYDEALLTNLEVPFTLKGMDGKMPIEIVAIFNSSTLTKVYEHKIVDGDYSKYVELWSYSKAVLEKEQKHNMFLNPSFDKSKISNLGCIEFSYFKNLVNVELPILEIILTNYNNNATTTSHSNSRILISNRNCEKVFTLFIGSSDIMIYNFWGDMCIYSKVFTNINKEVLTTDILDDIQRAMLNFEKGLISCAKCGKLIEYKTADGIFAGRYCNDCINTENVINLEKLAKI